MYSLKKKPLANLVLNNIYIQRLCIYTRKNINLPKHLFILERLDLCLIILNYPVQPVCELPVFIELILQTAFASFATSLLQ